MGMPIGDYAFNYRQFTVNDLNNLTSLICHCEPFTFCHSDPERSEGEESYFLLRVNSVKQSRGIATPACRNGKAIRC